MQQNPQLGNLEPRPASPQAWQTIVDLSLEKYRALKKHIMEVLSKGLDLWRERLETFKCTNHTIDLKNGARSISQQLYRARQNF